jgi:hypothetical protein
MQQISLTNHEVITFLRSHSGHPTAFADIVRKLSLMQPSELATMEKIVILGANRRELYAIKTLATFFPTLKFHVEMAQTVPITGRFEPLEQLTMAAELLMQRGTIVEGIFRLACNFDRPEQLRRSIAAGIPVDMGSDNPLDIASMFKLYTRIGFPHLITENDLREMVKSGDCASYLSALSTDRRHFLALLGRLCRAIDSNKEINRMDLSNLARVFAPNFFQHPDPLTEMRLIGHTIDVTKLILASA